jgi:MFS family permease
LILQGRTAAEEVSAIFGWSAAAASAIGVILGGIVSDKLRQRHAGGRLYVNMAAIILPAPAVFFLFTTKDLASFYMVAPYVGLCSASWVGAAIATLQDVVLPRMRGTAGATYVLGTSLVGLALGPYFSGKVAALTGSLSTGVFSLYIVPPFTLAALWVASRRIGELEATREQRAATP